MQTAPLHDLAAVRPPSASQSRRLAGALFGTLPRALGSIVIVTLGCLLAWNAYFWGWHDAVFTGTAEDCRAAAGACWAFVISRLNFTFFGFYPEAERWRAILALSILLATVGASLFRRFWSIHLLLGWVAAIAVTYSILRGGFAGLPYVPMRLWSGFVITIWMAVIGLVTSYPIGLALALGRRSEMPVIRWFSIGWIEIVRGVPLISILIMAAVILPLFLPEGTVIENLVRAQIAFALYGSAYLAEVFRAGLQSVPAGQTEGARSLGLTYWQTTWLVVMPQALRLVIPAQVNTFITIFKDTSLILVIGIFDFLGTIKAMFSDPEWLGFTTEPYLFAAAVYFTIAYGMSRYSRHLENALQTDHR